MSYGPAQTLKEGYEKFVIRSPFGCWDWSGCAPKNPGYGQFRHGMKLERAHRASWMLHFGEIPKGKFVCHKCDNKKCTNPDHLFLGTCKENNIDALKKGISFMGKKGKENHMHKLNEDQCNEILTLIHEGKSQQNIANIYNVAQTTISKIKLNKAGGGLFLKQDR